ncbi:MAG: hypothetical protein MK080_02500 [Opitutales bacterium]|nr:hypothetical protein [Opitutales bacterium]NRA28333.1 hypothetical protein [Opitutales bacterium]
MSIWIPFSLCLLSSVFSVMAMKGTAQTRRARWLIGLGGCIPAFSVLLLPFGSFGAILRATLPLGIIILGIGGLSYTKLELVSDETKRIYTAILGSIASLSVAGWMLVL